MKTNFRFPSGTGCSGRLLHGALHTLAAALLLFAGSACENEDPDVYTPPAPEPLAPLTLVPNMDPRVQNDIEIEEETTGVYRIHTTGEDPYFCTVPFDGNVPADLNVLAFEYQTARRTDHIQLFFWTEVDGEVIPDVERTIVTTPFEAADTWKEYSVRIRKCREEFFWGEAGNLLRIDFGTVKDADIRKVLETVFAGEKVAFTIDGKLISITKTRPKTRTTRMHRSTRNGSKSTSTHRTRAK